MCRDVNLYNHHSNFKVEFSYTWVLGIHIIKVLLCEFISQNKFMVLIIYGAFVIS